VNITINEATPKSHFHRKNAKSQRINKLVYSTLRLCGEMKIMDF